jgi:hypothetical protein
MFGRLVRGDPFWWRSLSVEMAFHRHGRFRLAVARFALAVSVALVAAACGGLTQVAVGTAGRYRGPTGWSLSYPAGTSIERSSRTGKGDLSEITFASFPQTFAKSGENFDLGPPRNPARVFPVAGVALRITDEEDIPAVGDLADSAFPVHLSDFQPAAAGSARSSGPIELDALLIADGQMLEATAFIGRGASKRAIANLSEMIGSLAFPPERRGTVAAYLDYDLGSPAQFPTGSFTLVRDPLVGLVYVVHAPGRPVAGINPGCLHDRCTPPGSSYGIAPNAILVHSGSDCRLLLDRRSDEFYCPGGTARWNRLGYPIGTNLHPPLGLVFVKTSWDGQLVLAGGEGSPGTTARAANRRSARLLWPGWVYVGR